MIVVQLIKSGIRLLEEGSPLSMRVKIFLNLL
jgi:hypothetical protein